MKLFRIVLLLAALAAVGGGGAYLWREEMVNWWVQRQLASELSRQLGAKVELAGAHYAEGSLRAARCRVTGERMPFVSLEIKDFLLPFTLDRLRDPGAEPFVVEASSADLVWRNQPQPSSTHAAGGGASANTVPPLEITVAALTLRHEDPARWRVSDTSARAKLEGGRWTYSAREGTFFLPDWPALHIGELSGQHGGGETKIDHFAVTEPGGGTIAGSALGHHGEWSGEFRWSGIGMGFALPAAVNEHFEGKSSGEAKLSGGVLTGRMQLAGAVVRNLPALLKLASIFTGEDYSTVAWEDVRFDFIRDAREAVLVSNLTATSTKGLAVRGAGAFTGDYLSADLELGLQREGRPWLVSFMPVLFRTEKEGYLWTPVKVGGTPHSPTENLTPRVVAALAVAPAAAAVQTAVDIPATAVDTAVEAADGLLRGLLGR